MTPAADAAAPPARATVTAEGSDPVPRGIEVEAVTGWIADHLADVVPPFTFGLVAGGRSNLTYRVADAAGHVFVLRRPPVSHVLPTAHDMAREYRLMTALGPTAVPVPATLGLCTDERVTGAPFYVMELVDGTVLRDRAGAEAAYPEAVRHDIGPHVADTLAALHAVDVDAVGLGDLGRRDGYVERQVRRWTAQYREMGGTESEHGALMAAVASALAAGVPVQREVSVVHGDYRLDNMVLDGSGRVVAVLDWEICTLGDPLADVGLLLVYWIEPGDEPLLGSESPTAAPGFVSRRELLDRYAATSGRDVGDVDYFYAFGSWKLACILQGVLARYTAGARAGDEGSVANYPETIGRLAGRAADALGVG